MNNKGYVLLETIIVVTILSVVLLSLYTSFSDAANRNTKYRHYDNTEYIYKTNNVKKIIINYIASNNIVLKDNNVICSDYLDKKCSDIEYLEELGVKAVYIISNKNIDEAEPTTLKYIKYLNMSDNNKRIVVMFEDENYYRYDDASDKKEVYEYASLMWK